MSSLYKDILLDHYKNPRNWGELKSVDKRVKVTNPFCGDEVVIELKFEKGKVKDIAFKSKGCVISTAATSILSEYIKGKSIKDLKNLNERKLLKLLGIKIGPVRMKCAMLPLRGVIRGIKGVEEKP